MKFIACRTVGDLRKALADLPDNTPISHCDDVRPRMMTIHDGLRVSELMRKLDGGWMAVVVAGPGGSDAGPA